MLKLSLALCAHPINIIILLDFFTICIQSQVKLKYKYCVTIHRINQKNKKKHILRKNNSFKEFPGVR